MNLTRSLNGHPDPTVRDTRTDIETSSWDHRTPAGAGQGPCSQAAEKHRAAVSRTLAWADESASRGAYDDALAWLHVLEVIGDPLSPEYEEKGRIWRRALALRRDRTWLAAQAS